MLAEPNLAHAHSSRGIAKSELGQYEAAIVDYNEAIKLRPDFAETYYNRGIAKSELGQYNAAVADYDVTDRLRPDETNAYIHLGIAKIHLGHIKEARGNFQIGLELAEKAGDEDLKTNIEQHIRELDNMK